IRTKVGDKSVFFFVSGGVDSTVAFALCARALSRDKVLGVYVDTGLMRQDETAELRSLLAEAGLEDRLRILDESEVFLAALTGVTDPEKKRHIIGKSFIDVQHRAMSDFGIDGEAWLLGQGTKYPHTVESGGSGGTTAVI
ncbi:GMP synthase (glutamine-hydrolyzing), partial [Microbacteriaceae bacterium K1510]|nr:GMP synthase (glutamine-hydrolyzing) [Microbacteriaceae bacterium K1510]